MSLPWMTPHWPLEIHKIPMNIINKWMNEEWDKGNTTMRFGDDEFEMMIAARLADPDNAVFLVSGPSHRVGYGPH